jgi:nicotinamide riboside kinase
MTLVDLATLVLLLAEVLVCLANWEYKEECVCRPRNKCKQLGLVDAEDIVEGELLGETKLVYERGHDLWVVFCDGMLARAVLVLIMSHPRE